MPKKRAKKKPLREIVFVHVTEDEGWNPESTFTDILERKVNKLGLKNIDTYNEQYVIRVHITMDKLDNSRDEEEE